jgi:hypothetical protein
MSAQLADIVIYTATDGTTKAAIVTAVTQTPVINGTDDESTPDTETMQDTVSLRVFSPTGSTYHKAGIPEGTGPLTYAVKA